MTYQPQNRKPYFESAKRNGGLAHMFASFHGSVSVIVDECYKTSDEKILEILATISDMAEVYADASIPDGSVRVLLDCRFDVSKIKSLLPDCDNCIKRNKENENE